MYVCMYVCMYVFKLYLLNPFLWSLINCKICTALCIEIEKKRCNFQLQASWWAYFKKQFFIESLNLYIVRTLVSWACCLTAFRIGQLILNVKYCCLSCSRVRSSLTLPLTLLKNPWLSCFKRLKRILVFKNTNRGLNFAGLRSPSRAI